MKQKTISAPGFLTLIASLALITTGCGDDPTGSRTLVVLDQHDLPVQGCMELEDGGSLRVDPLYSQAEDGSITVIDSPGDHVLHLKCGSLVGHVAFHLDEGENPLLESRLVGSFCTNDFPYMADADWPYIEFELGALSFSGSHACDGQRFGNVEIHQTRVDLLAQLCDQNGQSCQPVNVNDYLPEAPFEGIRTDDSFSGHLIRKAQTNMVPSGTSQMLRVSLRHAGDPVQALIVPVILEGSG